MQKDTKDFQPQARHDRLRTRVVRDRKQYTRKEKHKSTKAFS